MGSFVPSRSVVTRHISYNGTTCDFPPLCYHRWPYDSRYRHSFPYFLRLIRDSDSVIYNPFARDVQIGRTVGEIISGPAMVCGEGLGERAHSFMCKTSSAALTSPGNVRARGGAQRSAVGSANTGRTGERARRRRTSAGERGMAMSCANDESLCSVLRGDTAVGSASPATVLQLFPWSALCGGIYRMCVNLPAC